MNWTKTSDRPPEIGKIVVCFYQGFDDDDESVFMGKLGNMCWLDQVGDLYCHIGEVTHWCELPPLPEEQG